MISCWPSRRRDERGGGSSIEFLLLVPALFIFLGLIVASARVATAKSAVHTAAGAAARAASLERSPGSAQAAASAVAAVDLGQGSCRSTDVAVNTAGFAAKVGTSSSVSATVSCTVTFTDLLVPMPGSMTFTDTSQSPLDTYRGRR